MAEDASTIDPAEVARFARVAETWWDRGGPMRALHKFNPVRLAYIRDEACRRSIEIPRRPTSGGPLHPGRGLRRDSSASRWPPRRRRDGARSGPRQYRRREAACGAVGIPVGYRSETVESVVAGGERFDVVLAMEVVEHVTDVPAFVMACGAVKPGGILIMATLNRTLSPSRSQS